MPSNALNPDQWPELVRRIQNGDVGVGADLAHRERRFDNIFTTLTKTEFPPVLYQNAASVTYNTSTAYVEGFRIGPWVMINLALDVTATGGGNTIEISLPVELPAFFASPSYNRPAGVCWVFDSSAGLNYYGQAQIDSSSALGVQFQGLWSPTGAVAFGATAIANGDKVGYSIQYRTTGSVTF